MSTGLPRHIGAYLFTDGGTQKVNLGRPTRLQDFRRMSVIQVVYPIAWPNGVSLRTNFQITGNGTGYRQFISSPSAGVNGLRLIMNKDGAELRAECAASAMPYSAVNKWCVWAGAADADAADAAQKLFSGDLVHPLVEVTAYVTQTAGSGTLSASTLAQDTIIGGDGSAGGFGGAIAITAVWNKYLLLNELRARTSMLLSGVIPRDAKGVWYTGAHGPLKVYDLSGVPTSVHGTPTGLSMVRGFQLRPIRSRFLIKSPTVDQTIWQLGAMTAPTTDDLLVAVDDPSGTPATKKLTLANFGTLTVSDVVVQTKTVGSGTYTPTAGMKAVLAIGVGGGGGGAGGIATDSAGGGGGGGGTCIRLLTAAQIGASKAYVVGAKGTGQTASGPNNATAGTATTLDAAGALLNAGGGGAATEGAGFTVVGVTVAGGTGGTAANGDLNIPGEAGERGTIFSGTTGQGGRGGRSRFGFGGASSGVGAAGNVGQAYGGGGSGGHAATATNQNGADGADGILYLVEFIG